MKHPILILSVMLYFFLGICAASTIEWFLPIHIDAEIMHTLIVGMNSSATDGFDVNADRAAPPVPPVGFFAYIPCNDPKYSYIPALWFDIRAPGDSALWIIKLANAKVPVIVEWNPDSIPPGYISIAGKDMRELAGKYNVSTNDTTLMIVFTKNLPIKNIPNPAAIAFSIENPANISITVSDRNGNVVDVIHAGRLHAGEHSVSWNSSQQPGVYLFCVEADGVEIGTGKLIMLGGK